MEFFPTSNSREPDWDHVDPTVAIRTSQLICSALIAGVTLFLLVALFIATNAKPPLVAYVALGVTSLVVALRFLIPDVVVNQMIKALPKSHGEMTRGRLFGLFQIRMIIGVALLEGASFFNLVSYILEGQWWSIATVVFLLMLMGMMFPTLGSFEGWFGDLSRDLQNQF